MTFSTLQPENVKEFGNKKYLVFLLLDGTYP